MPTYTRHAVVGYFNDERSARAAYDDLIANGFTTDSVHLSSGRDYSGAATGGSGLTGRAPATEGGISGWFQSIFGSNDYDTEASRYSEGTRRGGYVVAVDATDQTSDRAVDILNQYGAVDVDENAAGSTDRSQDMRGTGASGTVQGEQKSIPVVREDLQVGKRAVQRGGVRVYTRPVEEPVEQQVRLREEHVVVDRQPVDRPVTDADQARMRDQTIEVIEMAEEPVVQKEARVVEEVRVGKQATERTETVRDTLHHTKVETEQVGAGSGTRADSNYESDFRRDFQSRYGTSGADYSSYAPSYQYGWTAANDARYRGKSWNEVESSLRNDYAQRYPESSWDRMKDAVRYGWEKVTGNR